MPVYRFILLLLCAPGVFLKAAEAGDSVTVEVWREVAREIVAGDSAYRRFDNRAALEHYRHALELDSLNGEAAWKAARACIDIGEAMEDKSERQEYFRRGEGYARQAIRVDSLNARGHLFLSIALGRLALDAGPKQRLRLAREIRREVETALALDSTDHVAWHVLGHWHRKIATLSWLEKRFAGLFLGGVPKDASLEQALVCFQKAVELAPFAIQHHYELAVTYEKMNRREEAIAEYRQVLHLPLTVSDDARYQELARRRLQELGE